MKDEMKIGAVVQAVRKKKKISLRKLSEQTGVTASMLSQIERDMSNPSINTLKIIASALDIPMYRFFMTDHSIPGLVVKKEERSVLGHANKNDILYELLTSDVAGSIEFCMMHLPPNYISSDKDHAHIGEEVAYVVSGTATVTIDNNQYTLRTGDSVRIPAGSLHHWNNYKDEESKVIFAITPPSF